MNSDHLTDSVGRQWVLGPVLGRGTWGRSRVVRDAEGREMVLKEPLTEADFPSDAPLPDDIIEACNTCARQQIDLLEHGPHHYLPRLESTIDLGAGRLGLVLPRYSTLDRRLEAGVSLGDLLRLVYRIALTLSESQSIHGELRPSNIVFGERGEAFLTDTATKALTPHCARLVDLAGKGAWIPPEARSRAGAKPTPLWDTWALCQILYAVVLSDPPPTPDPRGEPERRIDRRAPMPLVDRGLDKIAVSNLKEAVQARLVAENTNPRFRARVCDRLGALLARGLSPEHEPSPPYRFATTRDFAERVNEVLALLRPRVLEVGKVLFPANAADGIFRHGSEISFSVTVGCTHGITDHDDLVCGLQLIDLDAPDPASPEARTPVDATLKLQVHPSGRLRFQLTIPEIGPGRFRVRVAFAVKDSGDEPQTAIGDLEVRPPPGYIPPKREPSVSSPLPFSRAKDKPEAQVKAQPEPKAPLKPAATPLQADPPQATSRTPASKPAGTPAPPAARERPPKEAPKEAVVVGLFPRPIRPPEDEADSDLADPSGSRPLRVVQPDQAEPSEALLASVPSALGRGQPQRSDAPPASFRPDSASERRPDRTPNDSFRAVSLSPVDPASDISPPTQSARLQDRLEPEHTVPAPGTWPPSLRAVPLDEHDPRSLPSEADLPRFGASQRARVTPDRAPEIRSRTPSLPPIKSLPPERMRSDLSLDRGLEPRRTQDRFSDKASQDRSVPDDLPAAGDELPSIVGLPRPQGRLPARVSQLVELVRSDTYMALGAAVAASLVLLLITTALLKAC